MNVYQLPLELPFQILVQLLLELEANLLDQNVNELEFELYVDGDELCIPTLKT